MSLRIRSGFQAVERISVRSSPQINAASTVARYRHAERHCSLACVGRLDSSASVPRQEPPYQPLADAAKQQVTWKHEKVQGTLLGIRCPKWVAGINVPGYHWHFLSDDRKIGGHVLECAMRSGTIAYDQCDSWLIKLTDVDGKNLSQDLSRELEQVEKQRGHREPPGPQKIDSSPVN